MAGTMSVEPRRKKSAVEPGVDPQLRILLAAERLFGAHGLNGVSMRQINEAAGMLNNSAIAYHFGNKEALVRRIYQHRLPALDAVRGAMLATAEAEGRLTDVRQLLAILVMPLLSAKDGNGVHSYASFLRQMMYTHATLKIRRELMSLSPVSTLTLQLLNDAIPHFPKRLVELRLKIASDMFMSLVCERDLELGEGYIPALDSDLFNESILDLMTCVFTHAPSRKLSKAFEKAHD